MKFLPSSWRTADMIIRTFYNNVGVVNRIVYELPRHEEVNKDTKMKVFENKGNWYVIADISKPLEGKVTCALAEDKNRVIHI